MPKVTGIGGVFFRSDNPESLRDWYAEHLGIPVDDGGYVVFQWKDGSDERQPGSTVWAPFARDTSYFGAPVPFMINFRVDDLDGLLEALRASGVQVDDDIEDMEGIGRFGHLTDPEGNRIELWEPAEGC